MRQSRRAGTRAESPGQDSSGVRTSARRALTPWLFLSPAIALFLVVFVIPIGYTLWQSLFTQAARTSIYQQTDANAVQFAGIGQYLKALSDHEFLASIIRVISIGVVQVPVMLLLALSLALLLDARTTWGKHPFQLAYFLPYAIPGAVSALMWSFLVHPQLSPFTAGVALVGGRLDLTSPPVVPWTIGVIITWGFTGYNMVVMYAALKALPHEVLEAARVDGASPWRVAWRIKVPMIRPAIVMTAIFSIIGTIQLYNEPAILRNTASEISPTFSPIMDVYMLVSNSDFYGAAARSVILAAITLVTSFGFLKLQQRQGGAFDE